MAGRGERRDVQQVALALHDLRQDREVGAQHAEQVDLERALDPGGIGAEQRARRVDARVGDRDVDAAEALDGALDRGVERLAVRHVGLEERRAIAEARRQRLEPLGLQPDESDVVAARVQALGGRGADAARGAGDEHGRLMRRPPRARARARVAARSARGRSVCVSSRNLNVKPGHSVVLRPCLSMYQDAQPPAIQTVPSIARWTRSLYRACAPASTAQLCAPSRCIARSASTT